jgi:hypothetical protein
MAVLIVPRLMVLRIFRSLSRRARETYPEGITGLSPGFQPRVTPNDRPALKGRQKRFKARAPERSLSLTTTICRPFRAGRFVIGNPGLKPRAESCNPFGTKSRSDACPRNRPQIRGRPIFERPRFRPAILARSNL